MKRIKRVLGPWVLVKPDRPTKKSEGGIYFPDGNVEEKLGHLAATVVKVGTGIYNKKRGAKTKTTPLDVSEGDRVVFRGHLKEANRPAIGDDHCLLHIDDIVGVLEEGELTPHRPYDN